MNTLLALRIKYFCTNNTKMQREVEDEINELRIRLGMKCLPR